MQTSLFHNLGIIQQGPHSGFLCRISSSMNAATSQILYLLKVNIPWMTLLVHEYLFPAESRKARQSWALLPGYGRGGRVFRAGGGVCVTVTVVL